MPDHENLGERYREEIVKWHSLCYTNSELKQWLKNNTYQNMNKFQIGKNVRQDKEKYYS